MPYRISHVFETCGRFLKLLPHWLHFASNPCYGRFYWGLFQSDTCCNRRAWPHLFDYCIYFNLPDYIVVKFGVALPKEGEKSSLSQCRHYLWPRSCSAVVPSVPNEWCNFLFFVKDTWYRDRRAGSQETLRICDIIRTIRGFSEVAPFKEGRELLLLLSELARTAL